MKFFVLFFIISFQNILIMSSDLSKSIFNQDLYSKPTPIVQLQFPYNIDTDYVVTSISGLSTSGSGSVTQGTGMALISTNTTADSAAVLASINQLSYRPGQGLNSVFSAIFDIGAVNNIQYIGIGNSINGFFFGYNGTDFGILYRNNGSDTWYSKTSWNGTVLDFDPTLGNIYRIQYHWLGFGVVKFYVQNPADGSSVLVHSLRFLNGAIDGVSPMLTNGSMQLLAVCSNSAGSTSNITLKTSCMMGAIEGKIFKDINSRFSLSGSVTSSGSTIRNVFTILNNYVYPNGTTTQNKVMMYPDLLTFVNRTAQDGVLYLIINGTGSTPATVLSSDSVILYDLSNVIITPGVVLCSIPIQGVVNTYSINLSDLGICLAPGQILSACLQRIGTGNLTIDATLSWTEGW